MDSVGASKKFNEKKYKLYKSRAIIYFVFFAIVVIICVFLGFNVTKKEVLKPINYSDSGVVDYRVYLKENEFYSEKYLPRGKSYPTNLIDYIDINYNYIFKIDELANVNFDYKIVGDLIIENNSNNVNGPLLEKPIVIMDSKSSELKNSNELVINEKFQLNYSDYNKFANQYRSENGLDTNSYLRIYLEVKRSTVEGTDYKFDNDTVRLNEVKIPLSERTIEINIDSNNNTISNQVKYEEKSNINYVVVILIVLQVLMALLFARVAIVSIKKMNRRRSAYDKYVNKILKEYDRLVVETKTALDLEKYNLIDVSQFSELLDVRDNLKQPINYYCITEHIKGMFYIKNNKDVYILEISLDSIEND